MLTYANNINKIGLSDKTLLVTKVKLTSSINDKTLRTIILKPR